MTEESGVLNRPSTLADLPSYLADWVSRRTRADVQAALATYDLNTATFGVLTALADAGALSQQALANALGADKGHLVRLIDQLERGGLLSRAADPRDRRRHRIDLTDQGRRLLAQTVPVVQDIEAQHLAALSAAERRTLTQLLQRVVADQDMKAT